MSSTVAAGYAEMTKRRRALRWAERAAAGLRWLRAQPLCFPQPPALGREEMRSPAPGGHPGEHGAGARPGWKQSWRRSGVTCHSQVCTGQFAANEVSGIRIGLVGKDSQDRGVQP